MENIYEAADGLEALRCLRFNTVNLMLSDINMPDMDGLPLLRKLKRNAEFRHIPVIMITTEGGQAKVLEAVQLGAAGYVRKPFNSEQIKKSHIEVCLVQRRTVFFRCPLRERDGGLRSRYRQRKTYALEVNCGAGGLDRSFPCIRGAHRA